MAKVTVEVEVSKEAWELGQGVVDVIKKAKEALADGWQPGEDIPAILTATVGNVGTMLGGIDQLDDEAKADLSSFSRAVGLSVVDALSAARE